MLEAMLLLVIVVAGATMLWLLLMWLRVRKVAAGNAKLHAAAVGEAAARAAEDAAEIKRLTDDNTKLARWRAVENADLAAAEMLSKARAELAQAEADAGVLIRSAQARADETVAIATAEAGRLAGSSTQEAERVVSAAKLEAGKLVAAARERAKGLVENAELAMSTATARSTQIVKQAEERAVQIAGEAYEVAKDARRYENAVRAMKNIIEGYGDRYLAPVENLLDGLAEEFSHKDAGQRLKLARSHTVAMIDDGKASSCAYVESGRRRGAEQFVLDAFNGKVDSILSRVKSDNAGKLEQEIRDAFAIVNFGGEAFRSARITDEYLSARLEELKWGAVAQELKRQEQDEQRRIREQIREEERAQREFERAMREAAKEEDVIKRAMAKAQEQIEKASAEQRAKYELQLQELSIKLQAAEEKNQRALSMAQQTRRGHVYIISNVGSLGENVYKIGLTRRLDPLDRIYELGDSSVPFEFDVHALIMSEDAPALENQLHKHFVLNQVNKVNHRKEFFRASLADIRREIEGLGMNAHWTMLAEAREYRETLAIEKLIESDPVARESWLNRQLTLEPVGAQELLAEAVEEQ